MVVQEIVKYMLEGIINRKDILKIAFDRGNGRGMQIEKWILIEMLARLKELKDKYDLIKVEGEHKYSKKYNAEKRKIPRFEHCDLWWKINEQEYWLEVKTIVITDEWQLGDYDEIKIDIKKKNRMVDSSLFYHMTFVFYENDYDDNLLQKAYGDWKCIYKWPFDIGDGKKLHIVLYESLRGSSNPVLQGER